MKQSLYQLSLIPSHSAEVKKFQRSFLTGVFSQTFGDKVNSVDYRLLMTIDSVSGDTVSASFTFCLLTLFLPALLLISPSKSAFTHPCLSSIGKGKERVMVFSQAAVEQEGQVN